MHFPLLAAISQSESGGRVAEGRGVAWRGVASRCVSNRRHSATSGREDGGDAPQSLLQLAQRLVQPIGRSHRLWRLPGGFLEASWGAGALTGAGSERRGRQLPRARARAQAAPPRCIFVRPATASKPIGRSWSRSRLCGRRLESGGWRLAALAGAVGGVHIIQ